MDRYSTWSTSSTTRVWHGQSATAHVVTSQNPRAGSAGSWCERIALVCVWPFSHRTTFGNRHSRATRSAALSAGSPPGPE